jgi:hypothetical protein
LSFKVFLVLLSVFDFAYWGFENSESF